MSETRAQTLADAAAALDPERVIEPGGPGFVDLDDVFAPFVGELRQVLTERPRARVVVSGLPGVGKRTLVLGVLAGMPLFPVVSKTPIRNRELLGEIGWSNYEIDEAIARYDPASSKKIEAVLQARERGDAARREIREIRRQSIDRIETLCAVSFVRNTIALPGGAHSLPIDVWEGLRLRMIFVVDAALPARARRFDAQLFVPTLHRDDVDVVERVLAARIDLDDLLEDRDACLARLAGHAGGNLHDLLDIAARAIRMAGERVDIDVIDRSASLVAAERRRNLDSHAKLRLARLHRIHRLDSDDADLMLAGAVIGGHMVGSEREFDVHPLVLPHVHPTLDALHRIETSAIGPAPTLELELAPRINLLLGDNGLGKTFVLDVAWWTLTGSWPGRPAWPAPEARRSAPRIRLIEADGQASESRFDARLETWPRGEDWPRTTAAVIYARIDGGVSIWDPLRNDLHGLGHVDSQPAYHLSARELEAGQQRGEVSLCNGLIADWERWKHDDPDLFARFFAVVRGLFVPSEAPQPGPSLQLGKHDQTRVPTLEFEHGRVPLVHLSAGMKRIVALAYALVWTWDAHRRAAEIEGTTPARGIVLLVDEVESHLHPRWQRLLLPALLRVLDELSNEVSVQVLATTHSPMVLASLAPTFDAQRDRLFHFDFESGRVELAPLPWANFGDASAWLTSPLFGLGQAASLEAEQAIQAARAMLRGDSIPDGPEAIDARLRRSVPPEHPIWDGWRPFMRARKP